MKENKLIAEFMGAKFNDEGFAKITKITHNGVEVLTVGLIEDDFEYDFSWDWLMPVVEKIENHLGYAVTIVQNSCYTESMGGEERDSKLEATYKTVVEFIKYYNDQNK